MGCAALIAEGQLAEVVPILIFCRPISFSARCYGNYLLLQVSGLTAAILEGAGSVLEMPEHLF